MKKGTAIALGAFLLALAGAAPRGQGAAQEKKPPAQEAKPAESKVPPEEAKRANPLKPDAASIAQGKKLYKFDCEMCHGPEGNGKGDLADSMQLKLRDYRTEDALKELTDGEIYYIILKGRGKMPDDERLKPDQVWNIVNYLRSLAKKEPPAAKAEEKKPR